MAKKSERVSLRLRDEVKARLLRIVESADVTLSMIVERSLDDFLRDGEEVARLKMQNKARSEERIL